VLLFVLAHAPLARVVLGTITFRSELLTKSLDVGCYQVTLTKVSVLLLTGFLNAPLIVESATDLGEGCTFLCYKSVVCG
jgi:hypothetical protein